MFVPYNNDVETPHLILVEYYLNQWWVGIARAEVPVQASVSSGWSSSVGSIGSIGIVSVRLCIGKLAIVITFITCTEVCVQWSSHMNHTLHRCACNMSQFIQATR